MRLQFSDCEVDLERLTLKRAETLVHVEPQVFDLLACLANRAGEIVNKDDLVSMVWKGLAVSDATVNARISAARKAVGDNGRSQSEGWCAMINEALACRTGRPRSSDWRCASMICTLSSTPAAQRKFICLRHRRHRRLP
jgi:hypothetical protein